MAADGTIKINTNVDTSGIKTGTKEIQSFLSKTGSAIKKIGGMIAAAFAVREIARFGKECLELGSDLQEVQNVVDVTFPSMTKKVDEFAKGAAQSFGLSETMAKRYTGTFGSMAKSFGFSESAAYDMSTALTGLTGDVASFYNLSQDEAYTKLKSIFTGETESLKDLGVVMTQNALDSFAMANGYGKTTKAMSEQEKVALRYQFVMKQLSAASGDFIRTSDSWANQTRILKLQLDSIKATIGQGLINVFTPAIKTINLLLSKLATVANAFKAFTELITGKKSQTGGSTGITQDTLPTESYNEAADGAENLANATKDTADATKEAKRAAEGYLSPLDEINKLGKQNVSDSSLPTGSGIPGAEAITGAVENVDYGKLAEGENIIDKTSGALDTVIKKLKQLKKLFTKGFWEGLGDYKPILDQMQEDAKTIGASLKEIFTSPEVLAAAWNLAKTVSYSLGKISGSVASIGLSIASNLIGGIAKYLDGSKDYIKQRLVSIFDSSAAISAIYGNFYTALANVFSIITGENGTRVTAALIGLFADGFLGAIDIALQFGTDILDIITAPFINNADAIKTAIDTGILAPIATVLETLHTSLLHTFETIQTVYDEHIGPFFMSIRDRLTEIVSVILEAYNTYIVPVLQQLAEKLQVVWQEHVQPVLDKVVRFIGKITDLLKALWEKLIVPLIDWIVLNIAPVVGKVMEYVGEDILNLFALISDIFGGILDILGGFIDFLTGVFTNDNEKAWEGIQEIIKPIKTLIDSIFRFVRDKVLQPFINFLENVFAKDWSEQFGIIGLVMNEFFDGIERIWNDTTELLKDIIQFVKEVFTGDWEGAWNTVKEIFSNVFEGLIERIKRPLNKVIELVNSAISTINGAIGGVENAFSFGPWKIPTPFGSRTIGFTAHFPRIGSIPYLAKGAVIPPNAPFMAVMGDQKHGTNIEAPLATIEQAVRNVIGSEGGAKFYVTAEVAGRKLLDIIIDEAELRRNRNGRNPFALGGA